MQYAKIEGYSGLVRDLGTGSVLSLDRNEFSAFRSAKEKRKRQEERMLELETEVETMKSLINMLASKVGIDQS